VPISKSVKLGGINAQFNLVQLRDVTEPEIIEHKRHVPVITEARERLKLFQILDYNYREWKQYVGSLLSANPHRNDELLHLDRLLLNYVTCAYTIEQHFAASFRRRYRNNPEKQKAHREFLNNLYRRSWPTAFLLDFRGYIQHCGLGIGFYNRPIGESSVKVIITCDARELVGKTRWERSKLTAERGKIDIVRMLRECQFHLSQSYGSFIVAMFFPELKAAAKFYENLTKEVHHKHPNYRMVFFERRRIRKDAFGNKRWQVQFTEVPNDLFKELGLSPSV
jgi:hypothetical protein